MNRGTARTTQVLAVGLAAWIVLAPVSLAQNTTGGSTQTVRVAELTPAAETAIQLGLEYLIKTQNADDGSWGSNYKVAATSLGLMAFMVKGHFPERPPYGDKLTRAVDFLLKQADTSSEAAQGRMIGTSMYEHGLATLALSEVWGMSNDARLRPALKGAVNVILRSQSTQPGHFGGWRYNPVNSDADIPVTVMQVVALASAKEAGVVVPDETVKRAVQYVVSCQSKASGGFGYQPGGGEGFARTCAGTMSLIMCGQRDSDQVKLGLEWLMKQPDASFENADGYFYYAQYYATQAMYQAGDKHYQQWYPRVRDSLLKKQATEGANKGCWSDGQGIGTQLAILILGVPYRFLPIYQR